LTVIIRLLSAPTKFSVMFVTIDYVTKFLFILM